MITSFSLRHHLKHLLKIGVILVMV